jgi:hypothetical protein
MVGPAVGVVRPVNPRRLGQSPQPSWAGPPPLPGKCWPEQWMAKTCESLVTYAATPIPATSAVIAAASAMPARSRSWWVMISPRVVPGWSRSRTPRYGAYRAARFCRVARHEASVALNALRHPRHFPLTLQRLSNVEQAWCG